MANLQIIKAHQFDHSCLTMAKDFVKTTKEPLLKIYYNKKAVIINTGSLECPCGVEHLSGTTYLTVVARLNKKNPYYQTLKTLDQIARRIGATRSEQLFGTKLNCEDVPYYNLLSSDDTVTFLLNLDTPSFQGNDRVNLKQFQNRFCAKFLIDFNGIKIDNGTLRWQMRILQTKITATALLPPGCLLLETDDQVKDELAHRRKADKSPVTTGRGATLPENLDVVFVDDSGKEIDDEELEEYGNDRV